MRVCRSLIQNQMFVCLKGNRDFGVHLGTQTNLEPAPTKRASCACGDGQQQNGSPSVPFQREHRVVPSQPLLLCFRRALNMFFRWRNRYVLSQGTLVGLVSRGHQRETSPCSDRPTCFNDASSSGAPDPIFGRDGLQPPVAPFRS